jgi:hypothetical protein
VRGGRGPWQRAVARGSVAPAAYKQDGRAQIDASASLQLRRWPKTAAPFPRAQHGERPLSASLAESCKAQSALIGQCFFFAPTHVAFGFVALGATGA